MKFRRESSVLVATLFIGIFCVFVLPARAADLVNINSADLTTLEILNGIGPSKGQAIIDYRTQHGPFAAIEDIQNVSGIGPTTYANIKDYITVGDTGGGGSGGGTQDQSTTTTQTQTQTNQGAPLPPPITAKITGNTRTSAGAGSVFAGAAYGTQGEPLTSNVRYMWNFGDGEVSEGAHVLHTYRYPGTYALTLSIAYNFLTASTRESITVLSPKIALVAEGDGSLTIINSASTDLDIGLWSLSDSGDSFVIPEDTVVLAGQGLRFAAGVTKLSGSPNAQLLYPNGTNAASAVVAAGSPLRGEKVAAAGTSVSGYGDSAAAESPEASSPSLVRPPTTDAPAALSASVAGSATPTPSWWIFAGLAAVLGLGAAGAWYTSRQYQPLAATSSPEQEFELE